MRMKDILGYIENGYDNLPMFYILMSDDKKYVSFGIEFSSDIKYFNDTTFYEGVEKYIDELTNMDVTMSDITSSEYMFFGCSEIEVFEQRMDNVTTSTGMFSANEKLKYVYLESPKLTNANMMCTNCHNLECFGLIANNLECAIGMLYMSREKLKRISIKADNIITGQHYIIPEYVFNDTMNMV